MKIPQSNVTTSEQADGSLVVQIDQTAYVVRKPITDDGLRLTHIVSIAMTPLVASVAPEAAEASTKGQDFMPDLDELVMGLGQGMETMTPDQFIGLVKLCLGAVSIKTKATEGNPAGEVQALPLYETHFRVNFHHLGILTAYVIARGGVMHFFGGLATLINTLFPAQKLAPTSPVTSDTSTGS
jgi:hypothetical protein